MKAFDNHGRLVLGVLVFEHHHRVVMALLHLRRHLRPPFHVVTHRSLRRYSICAMFFY